MDNSDYAYCVGIAVDLPKPQTADKMLLEAQRIVARLKTARAVLWFAVGLNVAGFVCSIITCLSNSN